MNQEKTRTVRDALLDALGAAAQHNRSDVVAPAAILWPDRERRWERIVPTLRSSIPLLTLGDYDPQTLTGPAIWLRCAIAGVLPGVPGTEVGENVPVIYLPGVGKADLRAVEECPKYLQPLAELQYRGALFAHKNGRDMTPSGFLSSGLDIPVSPDKGTSDALGRALVRLMDERVGKLAGKAPLQAQHLDGLLVDDVVLDLLLWMDDSKAYRKLRGSEGYEAFCGICRREYGFDPEKDGELRAAELLSGVHGSWKRVWRRFEESPGNYRNVPALLDQTSVASQDALFENATPYRPSDNRAEEERLGEALLDLSNSTPEEARNRIGGLEETHGRRRAWVWAKLGESPLAEALLKLSELARLSAESPIGETPEQLADWYTQEGWKTDDSALASLASVRAAKDSEAVKAAVRSVYAEWLDETSRRLQRAYADAPPEVVRERFDESEKGVCILFVDGLRYDLARRLAGLLVPNEVEVGWRFAAIPGVTPTAKPCVSPVARAVGPGSELGATLNSGGSKVTAQSLRKAISAEGYEILIGNETEEPAENPAGRAWAEFGDIDRLGHERGWAMAREVRGSLGRISERIEGLLGAGWREVRVVTDHGWLMLPGGLPKVEMPEHLTVTRKGRCARMKPGSSTHYQTIPWTLDARVDIAVAPGIGVFKGTDEYEHGGISPQECVIPVVRVTAREAAEGISPKITEVRWAGLRCRIKVEDASGDMTVDLRSSAADANSSLTTPKPPKKGSVSLIVEDDQREGEAVLVVVLDGEGKPLAKYATVVGG